jgi:hypothetical protein
LRIAVLDVINQISSVTGIGRVRGTGSGASEVVIVIASVGQSVLLVGRRRGPRGGPDLGHAKTGGLFHDGNLTIRSVVGDMATQEGHPDTCWVVAAHARPVPEQRRRSASIRTVVPSATTAETADILVCGGGINRSRPGHDEVGIQNHSNKNYYCLELLYHSSPWEEPEATGSNF